MSPELDDWLTPQYIVKISKIFSNILRCDRVIMMFSRYFKTPPQAKAYKALSLLQMHALN